MRIELTLLAWSTLLLFVQMISSTAFFTATYGLSVALGNRDEAPAPRGALGRSLRAHRNMIESFVPFAAAVLVAHAAGREGSMTTLGAELFLAARVAYWPIYLAGVPALRTIAWSAGIVGIGLILSALF